MALKLKVDRVSVWAATIKDRPGGLQAKLEPLAKAGANLEFVIARRRKKRKTKTGVVFVTPLKNAKQKAAAKKAGFKLSKSLNSLRVTGPNRRGLGAKITAAMAEAGINVRGLSAAVLKGQFVMYLAFDRSADASKATRVMKKL